MATPPVEAFLLRPVVVQAPLPGSPKSHAYSSSWNGRDVEVDVVAVASKYTDSGATPVTRLGMLAAAGSVMAGLDRRGHAAAGCTSHSEATARIMPSVGLIVSPFIG